MANWKVDFINDDGTVELRIHLRDEQDYLYIKEHSLYGKYSIEPEQPTRIITQNGDNKVIHGQETVELIPGYKIILTDPNTPEEDIPSWEEAQQRHNF